jgi:hypothetical protein
LEGLFLAGIAVVAAAQASRILALKQWYSVFRVCGSCWNISIFGVTLELMSGRKTAHYIISIIFYNDFFYNITQTYS